MLRWTQLIYLCTASVIACACGTSRADDALEKIVQVTPYFSDSKYVIDTDPVIAKPIRSEISLVSANVDLPQHYANIGGTDGSKNSDGGVFTTFLGLEGSKQPQDFGVNANFGGRLAFNYAGPLLKDAGVGFQIGSSYVGSGNAVQVFELLGESTGRYQQYTTIGIFRRSNGPISFGAAYDHLYQNSFDKFNLGQLRLRMGYLLNQNTEIGTTANLSSRSEVGSFNDTDVRLTPIEMLNLYIDHQWQSQARTRMWIGVADGHGEANAAFGDRARKNNQVTFGAEIFAPLNNFAAIYGEANIIMPADTGAVDAYLGMQLIPGGINRVGRTNRFRGMFSTASSATFANDLKFE